MAAIERTHLTMAFFWNVTLKCFEKKSVKVEIQRKFVWKKAKLLKTDKSTIVRQVFEQNDNILANFFCEKKW